MKITRICLIQDQSFVYFDVLTHISVLVKVIEAADKSFKTIVVMTSNEKFKPEKQHYHIYVGCFSITCS